MPAITVTAILITLLALLQFLWFSMLVGSARARYGVAAPAVAGNEVFERYFRVQMNTLELLVLLLPGLWIAAAFLFVAYYWIALLGAVYLIGRLLYLRAYVAEPKKRSLGYALSAMPVLAFLIIDLLVLIIRWVRT